MKKPQRVLVELDLEYEYKGNIFIDYQKVVDLVEKNVISNRYFLIEEALNGVFELLNREFSEINSITCKISKPDILPNCKVSIKNSWRR